MRPVVADEKKIDKGLSFERSLAVKGVCICLVLYHHLFAFPERLISSSKYIPTFFIIDIDYYIAIFGKIAVAGFLFLSGFGLYRSVEKHSTGVFIYFIRKFLYFFKTYWLYLCVGTAFGFLVMKGTGYNVWSEITFSWEEFGYHILLFANSYNPEWWFARLYVVLLLLGPIFYISIRKLPVATLFVSISLFAVCWKWDIRVTTPGLFFWQVAFVEGMFFARSRVLERGVFSIFSHSPTFALLLGLLCSFLLRNRFGACGDFVVVPLFVVCVAILSDRFNISKILGFIGKYALHIWLVHSFFWLYFFQPFVYSPRYAPLIFLLLLVISLGFSYAMTAVLSGVSKIYRYITFSISSRVC